MISKLTERFPCFKKEYVISAGILFYLFIVMVWLTPDSEPRRRIIIEPVKLFWHFWGLDQNWSLFCPVIRNINYHVTTTVTFEDGSRAIWEQPRMEKLSYFDRFRLEKYRKWGIDSLPWTPFKEFWPDFARYVGRQLYDKRNKPVSLTMNLHWSEIPPPDKNPVKQADVPDRTKFSTVFCYMFKDEDFK